MSRTTQARILNYDLPNGVELIVRENHFAPAVAIQCWVGVGSIHETQDQRGLAHYLEHMLFKGTSTRAVGEIAATVEACGGDINAYTTFDHTVFYLTMAAPHAALGVELLADAIFNSSFDPEEFEKEREVILEEIRRSEDSPQAMMGRKIFELCFGGTEAGRPILGSTDDVRSHSRDDLARFHHAWYQPSNLKVIVVGDVEGDEIAEHVRASFGQQKGAFLPRSHQVRAPELDQLQTAVVRGDFSQTRLEVVFPGPPMAHVDTPALDLLCFALGSGELSRFNRSLRDDFGSVTAAGASTFASGFGGLIELVTLPLPGKIGDTLTHLRGLVEGLRQGDPVHGEEMARARANLYADQLYRDETVEGLARSIAAGMRSPYRFLYDEVYSALINAVPASHVAMATRRWLDPKRATIVALVPNDDPLTEEDLRAAWEQGAGKPVADAVTSAAKTSAASEAAEVIELWPGVRLVYRENPQLGLFSLTAATEGGLRYEPVDQAGVFHAMGGLMATASKQTAYLDLMHRLEGAGAVLEGFSGKDSCGFHLQCLVDQVPSFLATLAEVLLQPEFPERQWESWQREILEGIRNQDDSPAGVCFRNFQQRVFGDHPYGRPIHGTAEIVAKLGVPDLLKAYETQRDAGPWVLAAAGPQPVAEVVEQVRSALAGLKPQVERPAPNVPAAELLAGRQNFSKEREQTHICHGFQGLTWGDPRRPAVDVAMNVLGGHGGRLFLKLRDQASLAYTVAPVLSYGVHAGALGSYIACAPSKTEEALVAMQAELELVASDGVTDDELQRAKNYLIGSHDMSLQRGEAQTSTMALMELYGFGFDDFVKYPKAVSAVTAEQVQDVCDQLFRKQYSVQVIVGQDS